MDQLIIDKSIFQSDATEDSINPSIKDEPINSASRYLYLNQTMVYQEAISYSSSQRAENIYNTHLEKKFSENKYQGSWSIPDFENFSNQADIINYACGIVDSHKVCRLYALYGTSIVYMQMDISEDGFSTTDFYNAINMINEKAVSCINND